MSGLIQYYLLMYNFVCFKPQVVEELWNHKPQVFEETWSQSRQRLSEL